jgi:uncharacterized membrane protein
VPLTATLALFAAANLQVIDHVNVRFAGPALAFWFFFVLPAYLLYTTSVWNRTSAVERFAYSVAGALMLLVVGGLAINTALPWVGVPRPLASIPILALVDVVNIALFVLRSRRPEIPSWRFGMAGLRQREIRIMVVVGFCVPLVVFGANRLNNGSGDQVALVALAAMSATLILLLTWADRIASGITGAAVYLVSASLLLMTSLRGWSVTGHDIQLEYRVFQLTTAHGQWNFHSFSNAFNACLSITILPTEMASLMHVDDPYIYKVFFQLIFAACPVMVYAISRRYFSERISILAAIYFIGFPTFLTDMPYLNRQEMGLIFVGVGILAITNPNWSKRRKQVTLIVAAMAVELSHYSTSYLFVGTLALAWLAERVGLIGSWWTTRPAHSETSRTRRWATTGRTIGIGCLVVVAAFVTIWGGLATHTAGGAADEIKGAVSGFFDGSGSKSSAVSYGLFSGKTQSPQSILDQYREQTLKAREKAPQGTYLPENVVAQYSTPVVNEPNLPLTGIGRALGKVGVSASSLNTVIRLLAAYGEQVFVVIGLVALIFSRNLNRRVSREFFYLCISALVMLGLITVLPDLSVEYGVLRVFQTELIVLAPVMVIGSVTLCRLVGDAWSLRIATWICIFFFVSTVGLLPQLTGGYGAQLNLNNSGTYYDVYYMHPQEVAAVAWLYGKPGTLPAGIQVDDNSDRFAFTAPSEVTGSQYLIDDYPTTIQRSSWVILDYSIVESDRATAFVDGDLISYKYPTGLLQRTKNLVYNNGKTLIYQ